MTISATTQGLRMGVATSSSRPTVPFDGQVISETDTDQLKVYNGTAWIGVGGFVPVVPTSVAVGSGTGTANALGQVTFTTVSSVSLNGVFTSAYKNYGIVISLVTSGAATDIYMRLRASGTDNSTASSYVNQVVYGTGATLSTQRDTLTQWSIINQTTSTTVSANNLTLFQPQLATATGILGMGLSAQSAAYSWDSHGTHNQTVAYDGFTLIAQTGTTTGTVSVY